jgi:hypothetical protein
VCGGFRGRRSTFERKLAQGQRRVTLSQLGDFLKPRRQLSELSRAAQCLHGLELLVRGSARADEIGVVGVGEAVCARARSGHYRSLLEDEHGLTGAGECQDIRDRLHSFGIRNRVPLAVEDAEPPTFLRGDARDERRAFRARTPNLEVRRTRSAQRSAAEQRAANVGGAAARAGDDTPRRVFEGSEPRGDHAGLVQHLNGAFVSLDVQLISRAAVERPPAIRSDLRGYAEAPQQTEGSTSHRGIGDVQMNGNLTASPQVDASGRMEEA